MDHDGDDDDGDDVIGDDGVVCYAGMESLVGSDYRFEDITRWACVFQIVPTMREGHYRAKIFPRKLALSNNIPRNMTHLVNT